MRTGSRTFAGIIHIGALVVVLSALFFSSCAGPKDASQTSENMFQVCCCLGTMTTAQTYVETMREKIPELETKIVPVLAKVADDTQRTVYNIYIRHPRLTAEEVCERLAALDFTCPHAYSNPE